MYGLMKAHICSRHQETAQQYRMHYCGTCKTMGRLYGQKSRFLLNHDAVFLAELLTTLSPTAHAAVEWSSAYQSYNCFTLPENATEMPLPLQVAAAATLLMTEYKVADQIADGGRYAWKVAHTLLAPGFTEATSQMEAWGFPLGEIRRWGALQDEREAAARPYSTRETTALTNLKTIAAASTVSETVSTTAWTQSLAQVTEPTARVTALVFEHSGAAVGCDLLVRQTLYALGMAFGTLVYVLDAYEDYAKDSRRGAFNALQAAFVLQESTLPDVCCSAARRYLHELCADVEQQLRALPLPSEQAAQFVKRLRTNLSDRLNEEAEREPSRSETIGSRTVESRTLGSEAISSEMIGKAFLGNVSTGNDTINEVIESRTCSAPAPRQSLAAQWKTALVRAKTLTTHYRLQQPVSLLAYLASPVVFSMTLIIALLFPEQAKTAASVQECRDIACNLIFLGMALRRWTQAPRAMFAAPALSPAFAVAGGTATVGFVAGRMGTGVMQNSEETSSSSGSLTHSSSKSTSVTVRKTRRRNPCCGDMDCCDGCCCACEGAECCSCGTDCCCSACSSTYS